MAKNKMSGATTNKNMTELEAIKKSPELTEYIINTKIKSVYKSALIIGILACIITFGLGVFVGMSWTKEAIPNNVVQIKVGNEAEPEVVEK